MPLFGKSSSKTDKSESSSTSREKLSDSKPIKKEKSSSSSKTDGKGSSSSSKLGGKSSKTSSTGKSDKGVPPKTSKGDVKDDSTALKGSSERKDGPVMQRRVSDGASRPSAGNSQAPVGTYSKVGTERINGNNDNDFNKVPPSMNNAQGGITGGSNPSYQEAPNAGTYQYVQGRRSSAGINGYGPGVPERRMGSAYGNQMGMGSMYGPGGPGPQMGSAYGNQIGMGSMYGPSGMGSQMGSAYGSQMGMGSMYGPGGMGSQMGSVFGSQMGMGSMYGPSGMGSQMGSAYGNQMGMGSMYGQRGPMISAYGNQMGMGSMYGPGGPMTSVYGPQYGMGGGMPSMFGSQTGMNSVYRPPMYTGTIQRIQSGHGGSLYGGQRGINSMYGLGSIYGNGGPGISLLGVGNLSAPISGENQEKKNLQPILTSSNNGVQRAQPTVVTNGVQGAQPTVVTNGVQREQPTVVRSQSGSNLLRSQTTSKDHIPSLVAVTDNADSKVTLKEAEKKVTVKDSDGRMVDFEADEVLRASKVTAENSILLKELLQQVEASHNVALILASTKNAQDTSLGVAQTFMKAIMAKLAKDEGAKGLKYHAHMTAVAMPSPDSAKDLFASSSAQAKPVRFGSNPLYGNCISNLEEKSVKSEKDAEKLLQDALKKSSDTKETVVLHMVLKQIKKSSGGKGDVYLSSVLLVFVRENADYLAGIFNKDEKVVPVPLFKDVVGGSCRSLVVTALSGSDAATEAKILKNAEKLRSLNYTAPRSGNVARFMDFTAQQEKKAAAAVDSAKSSSEKAQYERNLQKLRVLQADGKELMAKPETTKPKVYVPPRSKD
ncbi:uncharacterized protein TM35_000232200 [Trypanosoma theileri]|uniref:Uncharacterized protein n=1 Tax=Trypanosoma theileri TaxID=67003 RepID=A0A1X0NST4_9TRYP|nr:uncharacterized protein TM35_000232200 [Trypanosoma theileri]ORC87249.1 hypothetical protein TM35_000232200 [Trypanosoma theileri]